MMIDLSKDEDSEPEPTKRSGAIDNDVQIVDKTDAASSEMQHNLSTVTAVSGQGGAGPSSTAPAASQDEEIVITGATGQVIDKIRACLRIPKANPIGIVRR